MRKFLIILLLIVFSSSALAEVVPVDNVEVERGFYVCFYGYNLYLIKTFSGSHGQICIELFKNDFVNGHSLEFYNPEMYFEVAHNHIEIRETPSSPDVYASGYIYPGFMSLTFDQDNYHRFDFVKNQSEYVDPVISDPFSGVRPLFEEGFSVPAGMYQIGVDLPDGAFSFSSASGCSVNIQQNNYHLFTIDLDPGGSFNKYILEYGQLFVVNGGSVVLKTYHGLFD